MKRIIIPVLMLIITTALAGCSSSVEVVISKHSDPNEIQKVAVFKINKLSHYQTTEKISDLLIHEFLKLGFDVVERSDIERLVKEQKLSVSGFIDPKEAVAIGKLTGADTIVLGTGELDPNDKDKLTYLVIKVISLKTGSVIITANLTKDMKIRDAIADVSASLKKSLDLRKPESKAVNP